jgi:hypothetical protein
MRKSLIAIAATALFAQPATAGEVSSVYTDLVVERDCTEYYTAPEGEPSWDKVCSGYRGYPVLLSHGDLRESVFFGFPPAGQPSWESFHAFNYAGSKIEWRVEAEGNRTIPFAAIIRWSISTDPDKPKAVTQALVVAKVAQMAERDGCVIGLVMANGNPIANEEARKIADEKAKSFACGTDKPAPLLGFYRAAHIQPK